MDHLEADNKWDDRMMKKLEIPVAMLPEVRNSSEVYGEANFGGGYRIPITGIAGDPQLTLFGQACFALGEAKNIYGTGCFLLMNTGEKELSQRTDYYQQ